MGSPARWRRVLVEGHEILVGRAARDNDYLTFRVAAPKDLWLHAAGCAGSHVVVRAADGGEALPASVVERAAELAAWHSKARGARGKVPVHICRAADVRKAKGAPPGEVQLRRFETLKVYPRGETAEEKGEA